MRSSGGADQPAGAVAEHVDAGVAHGREQARRHLAARHPNLECTPATTTSSWASVSGSWSSAPSSKMSTSIPPEEPEIRPLVVELVDHGELLGEAFDAESVGDLQARRVIGEYGVLVPEGEVRAISSIGLIITRSGAARLRLSPGQAPTDRDYRQVR